MILNLLRRKSRVNEAITLSVYEKIVAAARQKRFYAEFLVPDTPIGRYEMLSVHVFLFMHRLKSEDSALKGLTQAIAEEFFKDVDHSLRELGIGDPGIPKRMKKLARMYYGRVLSYEHALDKDDVQELAVALTRNVRPELSNDLNSDQAGSGASWEHAQALALYVMQTRDHLRAQPDNNFLDGSFVF
ncbi:ubiquinol-cytochrome C chaperone family protein [Pseudochrobactrum sp. MP213Fo]|uniref:ubiquinol-cytochrome C chaperone family protein n=1 Tax=Pseudochrobactrum sp. MP213Fo TaxID=3022250 RepID=UPI003BA0A9DA